MKTQVERKIINQERFANHTICCKSNDLKAIATTCSLEESSGRVLDLRSSISWVKLHQRHCVVSLSKTFYPLF